MSEEAKVSYRHNTIVLRNSMDEITFADVSCMTVGKQMTDPELRDAISEAVLNWRNNSEEGKAAWEESCEDFNIGDLVDYVQYAIEPNLQKELEAVGVEDLHIDTHSFAAHLPTKWSYDEVLGK